MSDALNVDYRPIGTALDDMEDNMDLIYHVEMISAATRGEHCCAYSVPVNGKMYKLNAQSRPDCLLDTWKSRARVRSSPPRQRLWQYIPSDVRCR